MYIAFCHRACRFKQPTVLNLRHYVRGKRQLSVCTWACVFPLSEPCCSTFRLILLTLSLSLSLWPTLYNPFVPPSYHKQESLVSLNSMCQYGLWPFPFQISFAIFNLICLLVLLLLKQSYYFYNNYLTAFNVCGVRSSCSIFLLQFIAIFIRLHAGQWLLIIKPGEQVLHLFY